MFEISIKYCLLRIIVGVVLRIIVVVAVVVLCALLIPRYTVRIIRVFFHWHR